jgi:hypothetical protein
VSRLFQNAHRKFVKIPWRKLEAEKLKATRTGKREYSGRLDYLTRASTRF